MNKVTIKDIAAIINTSPHVAKSSNSSGAYLAGQYLIQKGHTNIIHVTRKHSIPAYPAMSEPYIVEQLSSVLSKGCVEHAR